MSLSRLKKTYKGKPIEVNYAKCRSCHMPLGEAKDFTHCYDEYFDKRGH